MEEQKEIINPLLVQIADAVSNNNNNNQEYIIIKTQEMILFFNQSNIQVPQDFIQRFIGNFINEDTFITSERLYDWFITAKPKTKYKYDDFLKKIRNICKKTDLQEQRENNIPKQRGRQKVVYLISQDGVKRFMMKVDDKTCDYYIKADYILADYNKQKQASLQSQIQHQQEQILNHQQFIGELTKYKDILSVQYFLFQDRQFNIYGTKEDPLFLVNDIVCNLLGMEKINKDWFFRQNKTDERYVMRCNFRTSSQDTMRGEIPSSSQQLQERFKKSNKDYIYYFTESGLYKCLMRSNKPIAEQFQDEVIQLLKNIRLGVIGLQILNEQEYKQQIEQKELLLVQRDNQIKEYTKQLTDYSDQIESLQDDNFHKTQQLQSAMKLCNLYKYQVFDEQGNVIGEYGGTTIQKPQTRDYQHHYSSCNPGLKRAISEGRRVEMKVLDTFSYINENTRKGKERDLILSIEQSKRLNIQIPRVR